jgi:hypothetical protein
MWAWRSIFARGKPRQVGLWSRRRLSPTLSGETQQKLDFRPITGKNYATPVPPERARGRQSAAMGVGMLRPNTANTPAIFHFVMIKPSHYDDDGYSRFQTSVPISWPPA